MSIRLQPLARGKVAALGEPGAAWAADLPRVLDKLAERWGLRLGRGLPGGSASYVCAAETGSGEQRVVKVVLPDPDLADEAPVLAAAAGHGYVLLHDHDAQHRALLLERLGPSLETTSVVVEDVLDVVVDTLRQAWTLDRDVVAPGPDRAGELAAVVRGLDDRLGRPCPPVAVRAALVAAERLTAGDDPETHVVVHGDPHPANVLRVLAPRDGAPAGHVLVDPDGLRCDPAYDVGVALRDWTGRLGDDGATARRRLDGWVHRASDRAGLDPARVADWAYLERVSTGLYLLSLGADRLGGRFLASAAALVG